MAAVRILAFRSSWYYIIHDGVWMSVDYDCVIVRVALNTKFSAFLALNQSIQCIGVLLGKVQPWCLCDKLRGLPQSSKLLHVKFVRTSLKSSPPHHGGRNGNVPRAAPHSTHPRIAATKVRLPMESYTYRRKSACFFSGGEIPCCNSIPGNVLDV